MIQGLLLTTNQILVTEVHEVMVDLGEPKCRMVNPCTINSDGDLVRYLSDHTNQTTFMISSDKILTIFDPLTDIKDQYRILTGYVEEVSTSEEEELN